MIRRQLLIALGMLAAVAVCLIVAHVGLSRPPAFTELGLTLYPTIAAFVWLAVQAVR